MTVWKKMIDLPNTKTNQYNKTGIILRCIHFGGDLSLNL